MRKKILSLILCVTIVFTAVLFISMYNKDNDVPLPQAYIEKITQEDYAISLAEYNLNPILNGIEKKLVLPEGNANTYYKATIKDKGYNKKLPINVEVFFVADEEYNVLENSYFTVTKSKNLGNKQLAFLNTLIFAGNLKKTSDIAYITLRINTVYNARNSYDFDYISTVNFSLSTLETVSFKNN